MTPIGRTPRGLALSAPDEHEWLRYGTRATLSRSLAEEFNVFREMHHGTHEKQLSNVFAWLLATDATHALGDAFQRIFLGRINAELPADKQLSSTGYRVAQEVDTRGYEEAAGGQAGVVENYATADGHGHDYHRYLAHAVGPGRAAAVVLLCHRRKTLAAVKARLRSPGS